MNLLLAILVAAGALPAKNVIFFLGDGMGPTAVTAGRIYKAHESGKLSFESFEHTARIKTFSNDAQTTDSAPSMGAYMTGVKANNDVISMSTDTQADMSLCNATNGSPVATLIELAIAKGKGTGFVTTTEATHATPAATFAHICHRDLAYRIAAQATPGGAEANAALGAGVDVMFGGGANHWTPKSSTNPKGRPDGRDLLAELTQKGYTVATTRAQFDALSTSGKLAGLFSPTGHLAYDLDRDPAVQPSLAEMTTKAIKALATKPNGFFLMVEGGRIDHAEHGTMPKRALADVSAFDEAIKAALALTNPAETLIVVTADHDHTMTINGYGKRGQDILDVVTDVHTGQPALDADGLQYTVIGFGNGENRPQTRSASDVANSTDKTYHPIAAIRMGPGGETHGGGDVMLAATGAGSELFHGTLENIAVFGLVTQAAGY
jgi:alkaline phosphatase